MNVHPKTNDAYRLVHEGTLALARAELQGMRVDVKYATRKKAELEKRITELEATFKSTEFYRHWVHSIGNKKPNIHSNNQLARFLYKVKKLEQTNDTASGRGGSTDEESLLQFNIPELTDLLQIRKLKKIKDTYLEAFVREQVDGYMHPSFHLHFVATHRSSSSSPNFQNQPKRDKEAMNIVRKALFPRPGHQLFAADFGALEVRIAACYHKDPNMLRYIEDPTTDMHADMAKQIFLINNFDKKIPEHKILRNAAKNGFVFPQFYGDYYKNCAQNLAYRWGELPRKGTWKVRQGIALPDGNLGGHLINKGITSLSAFTEHIKKIETHFWGVRFKDYAKWKEKHWNAYQNNGYIDMFTGFRCNGIMGKNACSNYPVQGAAFHCLLWSFNRMDEIIRKEGLQTRLIGQIHDEIIFDVYPPELEYIAKTVKRVTCVELPNAWKWIITQMEIEADVADVDKPWADMHKYELT